MNGGAAGAMSAAGASGQGGTGAGGTSAAAWWAGSGLPDLVFHMQGTIDAGAEAMFCMAYKMPTAGKTAVPVTRSGTCLVDPAS